MLKQHFVCYVTGGLRSGKGLFAVRTMEEFLYQKRRIVTNYDLYLENLLPPKFRSVDVIRIPDRPSIDDLEAIGLGYDSDDPLDYDESRFGLICLDELGTWFNSRDWNNKGRKEIIDWLLHSGKRRWCLLLTIQDLELLDKQARDATANQLVARCMRIGNIGLPFITPVVKALTGYHLTLPDLRLAVVRAGADAKALVSDRFVYKGAKYYRAYNTRQEFYPREHEECPMMYCYLSPWHLKGRHLKRIDYAFIKKWCSDNAIVFLGFSALSSLLMFFVFLASLYSFNQSALAVEKVASIEPKLVELSAVAPVAPVVQVEQKTPDCGEFKARFDGFYIVGAYQFPVEGSNRLINGKIEPVLSRRYILSNTVGQVRVDSILHEGDSYRGVNDCNLTIQSKNDCSVELFCSVSVDKAGAAGGGATSGGSASPDMDTGDKKQDSDSRGYISKLIS